MLLFVVLLLAVSYGSEVIETEEKIDEIPNPRLFFTSKTVTVTSVVATTSLPGTVTCGTTTAAVTTCGIRRRRGTPFIDVERPRMYREGKLVLDEDLIQPDKVIKEKEGDDDDAAAVLETSKTPDQNTGFYEVIGLPGQCFGQSGEVDSRFLDSLVSSIEITLVTTITQGITTTFNFGQTTVTFTYAGCTPPNAVICGA